MGETARHFCTFFDSGYLPAGIALCESLNRRLPSLDIWTLCLDNTSFEILKALNLPDIYPVRLAELEEFDKDLASVKDTRTTTEYYFTCKPSFINYIFQKANPGRLTYLDSDTYFFRSPLELRLGDLDASVIIHEHNFPQRDADKAEKVGRYNAGFFSIRNDKTGKQCVQHWREQCLDWCYDRVEEDRYADQKYLNEWPKLWNADIIDRPGVGTARWNLEHRSFSVEDGDVYVDGDPLVLYHFEALQRLTNSVWNPHASLPRIVKSHVYRPYIRHRLNVQDRVTSLTEYSINDQTYRLGLLARGHGLTGNAARTFYRLANTLWAGLTNNLVYLRPGTEKSKVN